MYKSFFAALLMGMLPATPMTSSSDASWVMDQLTVAPPAVEFELQERLSSSGALIVDMQSGQAVFAKQVDIQRPMASLTKLMTALIIAENHTMDEWVTIPTEAYRVAGNKAYLPAGEKFTIGDLMSALLVASANDAAVVLAMYHSGSVDAFVEQMNERAQALGLTNTHYANPMGLDSVRQWSTPQDIAWLTTFALGFEEIQMRMSMRGAHMVSLSGQKIPLVHTHALLHEEGTVNAGKTGTTNGAKECLVSVVKEGGQKYLVVLMHSEDRYRDMRMVLSAIEGNVTEVVARH